MSRDDMWPEDKATGVETPFVQLSENKIGSELREAIKSEINEYARERRSGAEDAPIEQIEAHNDKLRGVIADAILDTVLAHLPEESRSKYALEESGYNQALSDIKDILMSSKGDA
ncbi:hypothetical protein [Mycobacteroides abscessus]|uniref:hypothetical protein n=1 Tax=Mycobacteroides abscessus TaxID=36809 RepID=UPI0012FFF59B|nr:hypothetical protein [Mycobacteroides abscessus]